MTKADTSQTPKRAAKTEQASLDRYCDQIRSYQLLDREQETELARRVQNGDESAREEMITANLRLVVTMANQYSKFGLPLEDLVAEGNIGLMTAVERFDPDRGARFSTYAAFWIKQKIRNALGNQTRVIRLPHHVSDKLRQLNRDERELGDELQRDPSDGELARHQGIDRKRVTELRRATQPIQSMDAPLSAIDPDAGTLTSKIADPDATDPFCAVEQQELKVKLRELLEELNPREQRIIIGRFGLDGETPKTLLELGEVYQVSRERIRQIQAAAIEKLSSAFRRLDRLPAPAANRIIKLPLPPHPPIHEALSA